MFLEDLTWTEVRDAVAAGRTTIIIPIGGVEQSGPFVALGKHDARARALGGMIARRLGNALVAPVVAYVPEGAIAPPTEHMRFPGTITVPSEAFRQMLESAGRSFAVHGFTEIVFLGDHGGYQDDLGQAADALNRGWAGSRAHAHAVRAYYDAAQTGFGGVLRGLGYSPAEIGTHAGLADTSLTLALAPGLVRSAGLKTGSNLGPESGIHGDPKRATAALGEKGVRLIVDRTTEAIRAFEAADRAGPRA